MIEVNRWLKFKYYRYTVVLCFVRQQFSPILSLALKIKDALSENFTENFTGSRAGVKRHYHIHTSLYPLRTLSLMTQTVRVQWGCMLHWALNAAAAAWSSISLGTCWFVSRLQKVSVQNNSYTLETGLVLLLGLCIPEFHSPSSRQADSSPTWIDEWKNLIWINWGKKKRK